MSNLTVKNAKPHIIAELLHDIRRNILMPALSAGLVVGILSVIFGISNGALIFSGDLANYRAYGIGLTLFGAFIIGLVVALTSSYPATIASPISGITALFALMAAEIAARMSAVASPDEIIFTTVASIALTGILTGIFFIGLGRFKLGNMIRFVPHPVMGGFLAGTGWLLFRGCMGFMADTPLTISALPDFFQPQMAIKWAPGFIFSVVLFIAIRRCTHFLVMPLMILSGIVLFYLILALANVSLDNAVAAGLLLEPFPEGTLWKPMTLAMLEQIHWPVVFSQAGSMVSIAILSAMLLLMLAGGIELTVKRDIDLNHELRSNGLAILLAGLGGGQLGFHHLSLSTLCYKMGSTSRLSGIIAAGLIGTALFFGADLLSLLPKPILGSLLLYLAIGFLFQWLYQSYFKLSLSDYLIVILILIAIGLFGFLQGLILGLILSVVIFVVKYSRIDLVKNELSGAIYQSRVERSPLLKKLLVMNGEQLCIYKLQGYIFFGTANILLERIRARMTNPDLQKLRFLLLDFSLVTGMDSSAMNSIKKMSQLSENSRITVIFTQLSPGTHAKFEKEGYCDNPTFKFFPDMDHGVEWCEEEILASLEDGGVVDDQCLVNQHDLALWEPSFEDTFKYLEAQEDFDRILKKMESYLLRKQLPENYVLINQGEVPDGIWLIQSGEVIVQLDNGYGSITRIQEMRTGTIAGEISLYTDSPAAASVVTKTKCDVYFLSSDNLKKMEEEIPGIVARFHRHIIFTLCQRVKSTNTTLRVLLGL